MRSPISPIQMASEMSNFGPPRRARHSRSIAALAMALIASSCGGGTPTESEAVPTLASGVTSPAASGASPYVASSASSGSSGLIGRVNVSPTCPGPQKVDEVCSAPLAKAQVLLLDGSGMTVGAATTSEQGTFEIAALAGTYRVRVAIAGRLPNCPVVPVTVSADQFAVVEIACDSGMR